jgi:hypothetical protein
MNHFTWTDDYGKLDYSTQFCIGGGDMIASISVFAFDFEEEGLASVNDQHGRGHYLVHKITEDSGVGRVKCSFIDNFGELWIVGGIYKFKKAVNNSIEFTHDEYINCEDSLPDHCIQKLKEGYFETGSQNNAKKVHLLFIDYVQSELRIRRLESLLNKKKD